MPTAIQIISKIIFAKLKLPAGGFGDYGYIIEPSKKDTKRPKSWAGNFAVVVPAKIDTKDGGKRALRFFLAKTPSHMTQITSFINTNKHPALVQSKIFRNFLTLKSEVVDMMEMDYVEGLTLDEFVNFAITQGKQHLLLSLADSFRKTVNELVNIGFYHGDLSHSNIMIVNDDFANYDNDVDLFKKNIRFIDYDSVLITSIQNPPETKEAGHPNFQHPSRKNNRFTILEDVYFSSLVIYISLIALTYKPKLWDDHHSQGDNLLFQHQQGDLSKTTSTLWKQLLNLPLEDDHRRAVGCLKKAVETDNLHQSNFLEDIKAWFADANMPTPPPFNPSIHPNSPPNPPLDRPIKPLDSPKPRPRGSWERPSSSPPIRNVHSQRKPSQSPQPKKKSDVKGLGKSKNFSLMGWLKKEENLDATNIDEDTGRQEASVHRPKVRAELIKNAKEKKEKGKNNKKKRKGGTIPVFNIQLMNQILVLDSTNILHEMCNNGDFILQPYLDLCDTLSHFAEKVISIFDASTKYKFTHKNDAITYENLISGSEIMHRNEFQQSPKNTEADSIILNVAHASKGIILGNDFYQEFEKLNPEAYDWFTKHHITVSYVAGTYSLNTNSNNTFLKPE